jgi:hypothetical protein
VPCWGKSLLRDEKSLVGKRDTMKREAGEFLLSNDSWQKPPPNVDPNVECRESHRPVGDGDKDGV